MQELQSRVSYDKMRLSFAALPVICVTLVLLSRRVHWAVVECLMLLSCAQLALELLIKTQSRGSVRFATRSSDEMSLSTHVIILAKRFQGFHTDHLFEYSHIGQQPLGYVPVWLAWLATLLRRLEAGHAVAGATALTTVCLLVPLHLITLSYTGRDGEIHGFGFNVYARLSVCGRRFEGERLLAIDWHNEKLPERAAGGRWLPRSQQRTVRWPHLHLCFLRLEFWPWIREPTDAMADAMADAQRKRTESRAAKTQRRITAGVQLADLQVAVEQAGRDTCAGFPSLGHLLASRASSRADDQTPEAALRLLAAELSRQIGQHAAHSFAVDDEPPPEALQDAATSLAGRLVGQAIPEAKRHVGSIGCG